MNNSQFWANFSFNAVNSLFDKAIDLRKNSALSEVDSLKETIEDLKEQITKLEYEKFMLVREVTRQELHNELLLEELSEFKENNKEE